MAKGRTGLCAPGRQGRGRGGARDGKQERGQVAEAVPAFPTVLEKTPADPEREQGWGVLWRGGPSGGSPHRLDVTVQEAHGVDGLNGLQNLLAQPQRGAQREGASGLAAAQVGQVPALGVGAGATRLSGHPNHHPVTLCPASSPKACASRGHSLPSPLPTPGVTPEGLGESAGGGPQGLTWSCITT